MCPELKTKTTNEGILFDIFALKIHKNAAFVPLKHMSDGSCGSRENQNVNSKKFWTMKTIDTNRQISIRKGHLSLVSLAQVS